jgi:hypothetical protein
VTAEELLRMKLPLDGSNGKLQIKTIILLLTALPRTLRQQQQQQQQ